MSLNINRVLFLPGESRLLVTSVLARRISVECVVLLKTGFRRAIIYADGHPRGQGVGGIPPPPLQVMRSKGWRSLAKGIASLFKEVAVPRSDDPGIRKLAKPDLLVSFTCCMGLS